MPEEIKQENKELGRIKPREITEEMKDSYIDYAMSVIVSRALPDVRDGLKPVHRRILFAMHEDGLRHDVKYRKSATVVGSVLGRYHPHGDVAVYDSMARMAQNFSLRYPLIDGQGNWGCFTKDTKVLLCDGRNLTFGELIKEYQEGKKNWTFSFNQEQKKIEIAEIKNPRLTRKNKKIIEITLDNNEKIRCTLNHRFMDRNGKYKEAQNLRPGDSLMPLYTRLFEGENRNLRGYQILYQPVKSVWEFIHHLSDEWNLKQDIYNKSAGRVRHHLDFNKLNNNPKKLWSNPAHRKYLSEKYSKITPEIYEKERNNNGVPALVNALSYFDDFQEIVEQAPKYNHKVVRVKILKQREDVYDLTVEPWHNFSLTAGIFVHNSIDGDSPAAMRYTECRMSKIGEEMLKDIEKNTADFIDNYDATRKEPTVLPSPMPQLLLNGSLGIAVGMATNIPPHNLREVADALIYLADHPKADTEDLFQFIKGPDFPTAGEIFDQKEILAAYSQGKGPILTRGKAEITEDKSLGRQQIIISEIPFQVQKSSLVEQFAALVQEKKIEGIKDIRDESDKEGMRIVIDLAKDAFPQKVLNFLYKFSDLQRTYHMNMLALVDSVQPRVLNLAEMLEYFIAHRKEVVERRTRYDLEKAKERAHILEGLHKCLANIDLVIKIIKNSASREDAKINLMKRFRLTEIQANAILETKLAALAKLERKKIEDELKELQVKIKELTAVLKSPEKIKEVVKKELRELKENFGDERKTKVHVHKIGEIAEEDLIPAKETVITLTQGGYIKRIDPSVYKIQKRGGKGLVGMKTVGEDIVEHFLSANTHDKLLFFTDSGKVFQAPVYEIPEGTRVAKGRGLLNFLEISQQEKVLSLLALGKKDRELGTKYLVMATKNGIVKKTALKEFDNVRRSGLIAIGLKQGDALRSVRKSTGEDEIILVTKKGQSIKFNEKQAREMGRPASGIKGIRLSRGDEVIGMDVIKSQKAKMNKLLAGESKSQNYLLAVTENGYGKRTNIIEYRLQGRGGSGIKTAKITPKTGELVSSKVLANEEDLIVISKRGQVIRTEIKTISVLSRATQGVRIMRLDEGDKVASATCI